ncbi:MAG: PEP-CTERM sorting domain-containing protein [Planctomycetia bacterium]|nr:PEP-CTERM sorting domain-containing protein [Planctomycetia bacterium]
MIRKNSRLATLQLFICVSSLTAQSEPTVTVFPTLAPNVFGSPSFSPWESNSLSALQSGATTAGDPSIPSYYEQIANGAVIPAWLASDFPSWKLQANPGAVFGPAFASELGNRLYFNLHIVGNGTEFSLSQVSFQATSSDPGNFLGFSVAAGTYNYSNAFVGLNYGPDNTKGTGDDFFVTSGLNTQLVDELFARGSGNAPTVLSSDPGVTDDERISNALAGLPSSFIFQGDYLLSTSGGDVNGSAFVVVSVPEPSTVIMACVGGAGLVLVGMKLKKRRRRKMRAAKTSQA